MTSAPEAFEKWWQSLKLGGFMNDEIMPDHVRQAFDLGVMFERQRCKAIADLYVEQARPAGDESVGDCPLTAHFDGQRLVAENIGHDIEHGL